MSILDPDSDVAIRHTERRLRDDFAKEAMSALVVAKGGEFGQRTAEDAYRLAELMLKTRKEVLEAAEAQQ